MNIAIISGATSGIGKSIAIELDKLSLDEIWLIGRNESKLKELTSTLKTSARPFSTDLSHESAFDELAQSLSSSGAKIEYLVCSAGVGFTGNFSNLSREQICNMVDINCKALTMLTCIALPYMNEKGKIIEIASGAGFLPQPQFSVYSATKSYVISFAKALRYELKSKKISVTAVCPGPVDTEFFANLDNISEYKKKYLISPLKVAMGSIKAVNKNRAIYSPTFSMKLVHLVSKILPTSLILKFYK